MLEPSVDSDQPFAPILSAIKAGERVWTALNSVQNILFVTQFPFPYPTGERAHRRFPPVKMIEYDESLRARSLDQKMAFEPRSDRPRLPRGNRGCPTDDDARADCELRIYRIANRSTCIVEIDVHAFGATGFYRFRESLSP
jgi:hypothetical protein